jgi:hypothetical protein
VSAVRAALDKTAADVTALLAMDLDPTVRPKVEALAATIDSMRIEDDRLEAETRCGGTLGIQADPGLGALGGGGALASLADYAARAQQQATDMQQAQTILTQMQAEAMKRSAERWRILMDTQTKVFETVQDVTILRTRVRGVSPPPP